MKEVVKALDPENADEREDENSRKETKAPEFMDKLKEVVKALDPENSKIVFHSHSTLESPQNSKIVFHSNSTKSLESPHTKSLESPQTPRIGGDFLETNPTAKWTCILAANWTCNPEANWTCNPAANWKKRKKNFFEELEGTVNHDVPEIGSHNEVTVSPVNQDVPEAGFTHSGITINKVHQSTSYPGCLKVIIVKPIVFYKEFGEDSEFFNDCLATQKELRKSGHSGPRFFILMKNLPVVGLIEGLGEDPSPR